MMKIIENAPCGCPVYNAQGYRLKVHNDKCAAREKSKPKKGGKT